MEDGDEPLRLYFQGRLEALAGNPAAARSHFARVLELDSSRPEPYIAIAGALDAEGDFEGADAVLREALGSKLRAFDGLWDSWLRLWFGELAGDPRAVLAAYRSLAGDEEERSAFRRDVDWLLETLSEGKPLRINCGGKDGEALGTSWSRDRFFAGGITYTIVKLDRERHRIDTLVDGTERYFTGRRAVIPGYRIPLPEGRYRVSLRFTEGFSETPGEREFDVFLEGEALCKRYSPKFGVPEVRSREIEVGDGALEIDFARRRGNPKITAIEVERTE
jgi:hypothetical protein